MTPRIILCPGQGAQFVGMGKSWFDKSPEARAVFDRADKVLGDRLGGPLSKLCFEGGGASTNGTNGGVGGGGAIESHVVATAGLSLGEYTALHLAGAFSFEDGLELVLLRGRAMQDAADAIKQPDGSPGSGMVALIGADDAQASVLCRKVLEKSGSENRGTQASGSESRTTQEILVPANYNCPGQIVISGSIAACKRVVQIAAATGIRAQQLQVAGAFHSPLMAPAAERLAASLKSTPIQPPRCPVMSNVTGVQHQANPGGGGGRTIEESIRSRLVEQLTSPVRWEQDCRSLLATHPGAEWHELAPGRSLMGMMRRIDKAAKVETHDEP